MYQLEYLQGQIRTNNPRMQDESIDEWLRRTWLLVLAEYERDKPPLPLVEERAKRSDERMRNEKVKGMD